MGTSRIKNIAVTLTVFSLVAISSSAFAARISDIRNTKHNFSSAITPNLAGGQSRVVSATTERQICVFCHTPHAAEPIAAPLWNRKLSSATYSTYQSGSIDVVGPGQSLPQPTGISKLCLSCHDGTLAIGAVNVLNGRFTDLNPNTVDIAMTGTATGGTMAEGEGATTGFTRRLGTDLTNDHPISITLDTALVQKDGEMNDPATSQYVKVRARGVKPLLPLENNGAGGGMVQCNTCHDPHIRDNALNQNVKFLRAERLQISPPTGTAFNPAQDIICLACHNKAGWVGSAHANNQVANEVYSPAAAATREFPPNTQVWQTACLACHDPHTVQGARRLVREAVDGATKTSAGGLQIKVGGGQSAIEEGCYACHGPDAGTLNGQGLAGFEVPNVKTDFTTGATRMPITTVAQGTATETHNIGDAGGATQAGKDFLESPARLAVRHVECPDCHNPHRVIKNRVFNANPNTPDPGPTHQHGGAPHTNIASGVLKGIWGVEPSYASTDFQAPPVSNITFQVKRGDPPVGGSDAVTQPYLTREYQLCLKCHSNYAYGANPPMLGVSTPSGTNGMTQYTNQANEYNSPVSHQGEGTKPNSGAAAAFATNNHRSWHPVIRETGRTPAVRAADPNNWVTPFNLAVGTQTMYCTDCHGSNTAAGTAVPDGGENGNVWGPHGSSNVFLLKGPWSGETASGTGVGQPTHICFKCHEYDQYANSAGSGQNSGFALGGGMGCMMGGGGGGMGGMGGGGGGGGMMCMPATPQNLHTFHAGAVTNFRCNLCHIAVPHGWKNKVFLNNLNDVGPEIPGYTAGTQVRNNTTTRFVAGPYYNGAALKVVSFAVSGQWSPANCGSAGAPGNGATGVNWMAMSSEACVNTP